MIWLLNKIITHRIFFSKRLNDSTLNKILHISGRILVDSYITIKEHFILIFLSNKL